MVFCFRFRFCLAFCERDVKIRGYSKLSPQESLNFHVRYLNRVLQNPTIEFYEKRKRPLSQELTKVKFRSFLEGQEVNPVCLYSSPLTVKKITHAQHIEG